MLALAAPLFLANPIEKPIDWIVGSIGNYLQGLHAGSAVDNPLALLVPLKNPQTEVAQNPLARIVPGGGDFQRIATSVKAVGYVLFAILLIGRMLKLVATGRFRSPEHVLFDLAPKLVLGVLAMQFFDEALNDVTSISMEGAFLLENALLLPIHPQVNSFVSVFPTTGLGVLLGPTLYVLVAYLLLLVITSRLVLLLGALISPLGIPIAIQSEHGKLAGTWMRMLVSGLLVPVLAGLGVAGSLAVAWLVDQITGQGPFLSSYLGALTAECGLLFTAFATTAMFKDAVKQAAAGVRGSFEGVGMGAAARAPSDALETARRGAETGALVAMMAAAPGTAPAVARAVARDRPEPDAGTEGAAPPPLPLPGGRGGTGAGSPPSLPAPKDGGAGSQRLLPAPEQPGPGSRPLLLASSDPDLGIKDLRPRRSEGGKVSYEVEALQYAHQLARPSGDISRAAELSRAVEA